jgi:hypothetical protein
VWHFFLFLPHFILLSFFLSLPQLVLFSLAVHTKPPTFLFPKLFLRVRLLCECVFVCFSILIRERKEILKKKGFGAKSQKLEIGSGGILFYLYIYKNLCLVLGFAWCVFLSSLVELVLKNVYFVTSVSRGSYFLLKIRCCFVNVVCFKKSSDRVLVLLQSKRCVISE